MTRCRSLHRMYEYFLHLKQNIKPRTSALVPIACVLSSLWAGQTTAQTPSETDFQKVTVAEGINMPMEFEISMEGDIFIVSKCGEFWGWNLDGPAVTTPRTMLPNVRCEFEDGLLSIALDPDFTTNRYAYLQYMAPGAVTRVSRFIINTDYTLNLGSETLIIEWPSREASGHAGGSMMFDNDENLLISTGDNNGATGYFSAGGQRTSGNTNDLKGKVLRIKPGANGGYTIPAGNLFAGDALHRPEIYAMGFRNPFRMNIDRQTGYIYLGDVGPDSSAASAEGPMGQDEINEIKQAGNFGWPYVLGFNEPYPGFDPNNIINNYQENTGATQIPPAIPAVWTILHRGTMSGPVYRFNDGIQNDYKLPPYYDGHLIFWDFNSSKFFSFHVENDARPPQVVEMPFQTQGMQGAIDVELDPRTHQLYVMQWGSGCCDHAPFDNGGVFRFDYVGGLDDGENIALGATATASTEIGGNLASHAVDGNLAQDSRWESEHSDPQYLQLDLHAPYVFDTIKLVWEAAYSSAYTIEASTDASNWDMLVNTTNGQGGTEVRIIDSTTAYQYVRITGTARGTGYGHSLIEVEIYAADQTEPPGPLPELSYLNMPRELDQNFTDVPQLLSQTGAFSNVNNLTVINNMVPFEPNAKLWSDRALKKRWISLPVGTQIQWSEEGHWIYPEGTVAVKHFELPVDERNPNATRRLETRLLVVKANGRIYGVTYRWRADYSDAELLTDVMNEDFSITDINGNTWTQTWTYPSPTQCLDCHTDESSKLLGPSTRNINSHYTYPNGASENQLVHWNNRNMFNPAFNNLNVDDFDRMLDISDTSGSLEDRVKSYLDVNCAHCHGTGNGGSQWDARWNTPLAQMRIIDENTTGIRNYQDYYGISDAKVVSSLNPHESILYIRDKSVDPDDRMPPIGRALEDEVYINVLDQWMTSLTQPTPTPDPNPTGPAGFTYCADENGTCNFPGNANVAYGANGNFAYLAGANSVACNNATFGDPAPNVAKACFYQLVNISEPDLENPFACTATSSSVEADYVPANVCDSDNGTRWSSEWSDPQWVMVDLGETKAISQIEMLWEAAYGSVYDIQVSNDANNWQTVYSETQGNGELDTIVLNNVSARYVRMYGTQRNAEWGYSIYTFNVFGFTSPPQPTFTPTPTATPTPTPTPDPTVALACTATSSSQEGDYVANNVCDDDHAVTRWSSEFEDPQWIRLDLGQIYNIVGVELIWESAYGSVYDIQVSNDGNNWNTVYTEANGDGEMDSISISNASGRYLRIYGRERGTGWGYSLFTVQVFGYVDGGPTPTPTPTPTATPTPTPTVTTTPTPTPTNPPTPTDVPAPHVLTIAGTEASSSIGGNTPDNLFDGDMGSRWESEHQVDPQFVIIDLGQSTYVTRLVIHWEGAYAKSYSVDISSDQNNWTSIYATTTGNGGEDDILLNGQEGRYLRIYGTERALDYGYSILEASVEGLAADPAYPILNVTSPANGGTIAETDDVILQVDVTDVSWFANGGSYHYSLDNAPAVQVNNLNAINLGQLSTGQHSLYLSLVNSGGQEVSVPRQLSFSVNCGNNCPTVLVFSKTSGFRHGSIEAGIEMVQNLGTSYGYHVTATEDSAVFTDTNLAQYNTIVFMNTTGDIFTDAQKAAFQRYMENGGGYVGTHSAADTEHSWDWYTDTLLAGAEFIHHGDGIPTAEIDIESPVDPILNHITGTWSIADEWYFFKANPRDVATVDVLANLDRSSYASNYPVEDHPIIFKNFIGSGRVFYTAIGHRDENFADEEVIEMIRKAIEWTAD